MYDLCQKTHRDWIELDDMNNLADTKGGNINAHIYSNLLAGGPQMLCCAALSLLPSLSCGKPPSAELIQKCISSSIPHSELFAYKCIIIISRLIHDKNCYLLSFCVLKVTFFSWPLPQHQSYFPAQSLIEQTWSVSLSSAQHAKIPLSLHDITVGADILYFSSSQH